MKRLMVWLTLIGLLAPACTAGAGPTQVPTATPTQASTGTMAPSMSAAPSPTVPALTATVTFDGTTCTYAGPSEAVRGTQVKFSLTNTPAALVGSVGGVLAVAAVNPGTTRDEVVTYMETHPASNVPPFAIRPLRVITLGQEDAAQGKTLNVTVTFELYGVYVATSPGEGDKGYFCALLAARTS